MSEKKSVNLPETELEGLKIPAEISSFDEGNADWVFVIYLLALSALELEETDEYLVLEEDSFTKVYAWLESNLFPHLDDKHKHEICFGLGCLATTEGIVDYTPSDFFADEYEEITTFKTEDKNLRM